MAYPYGSRQDLELKGVNKIFKLVAKVMFPPLSLQDPSRFPTVELQFNMLIMVSPALRKLIYNRPFRFLPLIHSRLCNYEGPKQLCSIMDRRLRGRGAHLWFAVSIAC